MSGPLPFDDGGDDEPTAPFWMATFSDMVTLLLTFFVMLVAMSEVEVKKFKSAISYFQGHDGILASEIMLSTGNPATGKQEQKQLKKQADRYEELLQYIEKENLQDKVQASLTDDGLHVVMTDSLMFRTGETDLIRPARDLLGVIARFLDNEVKAVTVSGHTDNQPIRTGRFPSNWELSTARATSVVRYLLARSDEVPASSFRAVGHGEWMPVATNTTPAGRARNRRVEIYLSWDDEASWQNNQKLYKMPRLTANR